VWIGSHEGMLPGEVARELAAFQHTLQRAVAALDARYPAGQELDGDGLAAVIDLCAWTHAEWVRIHPFGNGNGRTARIWANALLMRYGLPCATTIKSAGSSVNFSRGFQSRLEPYSTSLLHSLPAGRVILIHAA
jgi:hypothetical protein